jgi:hypothetical protein
MMGTNQPYSFPKGNTISFQADPHAWLFHFRSHEEASESVDHIIGNA